MKINKIIPLNGHLYIEPVAKHQVLVSDIGRLETFGKVIAIPEDESEIQVGDYVAFELWDVKDVSQGDKKYYMVKAYEIICKVEFNDISE